MKHWRCTYGFTSFITQGNTIEDVKKFLKSTFGDVKFKIEPSKRF